MRHAGLAIAILIFASAAPAWSTESVWLFGSAGQTSTSNQGTSYAGYQFQAGVRLPSEPHDRTSIGFSLSRVFDPSLDTRTNLIAHADYRLIGELEVGFLGGVQILHWGENSRTYLKPLVGGEMRYTFLQTRASAYSIFAAYEAAGGSTGSLALDGGTHTMSSNTFALGLTASFGFFEGETSSTRMARNP
jgi:hypothetical protein